MRILIAAGIYPPDAGGPAVHAKAQYEGFPRFGAQTGLVALAHYRHWPKGVRHFLYLLKLISKASKYDIIYAHDAVGAGIPALMASRLFGKKFAVRIGGDLAWEHGAEKNNLSLKEWYATGNYKQDRMYRLSSWLMRHADLILVPSPLLVELYTGEYFKIKSQKIKLILNPLPEAKLMSSKVEQTIIWASRITAYKNLDSMLRALSKVFPAHPKLKFVIMGDGPGKSGLEKLVSELNIQSNIVFTGPISLDEVLKKTSECLFGIAPALTEFNPNYILQCISFGKPFLISKEHGMPFVIPKTMLLDPRDEKSMYDGINWLLDSANYDECRRFVSTLGVGTVGNWHDNLQANITALGSI